MPRSRRKKTCRGDPMPDRIEIDLSSRIFIEFSGDGALFVDADGDEILFRVTGNHFDQEMAAAELRRAVKKLEGR